MPEVTPDTSYQFRFSDGLLGAQMLFVAFSALVLVPILTGLDPNVALFTAGLGTLIFQVITKGKVPVSSMWHSALQSAFLEQVYCINTCRQLLPGRLSW